MTRDKITRSFQLHYKIKMLFKNIQLFLLSHLFSAACVAACLYSHGRTFEKSTKAKDSSEMSVRLQHALTIYSHSFTC